mgnify:CR=1 FL=1
MIQMTLILWAGDIEVSKWRRLISLSVWELVEQTKLSLVYNESPPKHNSLKTSFIINAIFLDNNVEEMFA